MGVPAFLLRKLYKRGSLRETADGCFAFSLQNRLGTATLTAPPKFVINGVAFDPDRIDAGDLALGAISEDNPYSFRKGSTVEVRFPGRLLRGGNRIHLTVPTKEYGRIDFLVEDREAEFCDVPARKSDSSEE